MFKKIIALAGAALLAFQGVEANQNGNLRNLQNGRSLVGFQDTVSTGSKTKCTSKIMSQYEDIVNFSVARDNPYISWIERQTFSEYRIHSQANYTDTSSKHSFFDYDDILTSVKVSADGKYVLVPIPVEDGSYLFDIETFNVRNFYSILEDYDPDEDGEDNKLWLLDSDISPNGEFIVQSLANNHIVVQDFENTKYIDTSGNYYGTYKISVGDNMFLTNRTNSFVELFTFEDVENIKSSKDINKFDLVDPETNVKINYAAFSPNGKVVATAGYNGFIHVFDASNGKLIGALDQHGGNSVVGVNFNSNSTQLASIDDQGVLCITYFEGNLPSNFTKYDTKISNFNKNDETIARNIYYTYDDQQLLYLTNEGQLNAFTIEDCAGSNFFIDLSKYSDENNKKTKPVDWKLILIIIGGIIGGIILIGSIVTLCKICSKRNNNSDGSIHNSKKSSNKSGASGENYEIGAAAYEADKKSNSTISQSQVVAQQSAQLEQRPVFAQPTQQSRKRPQKTSSDMDLQNEINNKMSSENNQKQSKKDSETLSQQLQKILQEEQQEYDAKESEQNDDEENSQEQNEKQQENGDDNQDKKQEGIIRWDSENVPDEDVQDINKVPDQNMKKNNSNSNNENLNIKSSENEGVNKSNIVIKFDEEVDSAQNQEM